MMIRILCSLILIFLSCVSCTSTRHIQKGMQKEYQGQPMGRVILFPALVAPNPMQPPQVVDTPLLQAQNVLDTLENKVLNAFQKQKNVQGYRFSETRRALQGMKTNGDIQRKINQIISDRGQLFYSYNIVDQLRVTRDCRNRKNFLDFYSYCLSDESNLIMAFNELSSGMHAAEVILMPVITRFQSLQRDGLQSEYLQGALLLIDSNNGKLIWGNLFTAHTHFGSRVKESNVAEYLIDKAIPERFWKGFPQRDPVGGHAHDR